VERPAYPVKVPFYRQRHVRVGFACALVVTVLVSGSVMAYLYYNDNFPKRMSALEAKIIADRMVRLNDVTLPLTGIEAIGWPKTGDLDERGRSTLWHFHYRGVDRDNNTSEEIVITVYAEGTPAISYHPGNALNAHPVCELRSPAIDSTTAYKIAIESAAVREYRARHSGEYLEGFGASYNHDYQRSIWVVVWRDEGSMDDPSHTTTQMLR